MRNWVIAIGLMVTACVVGRAFAQEQAAAIEMTQREKTIYRIGYLDKCAEELRSQLAEVEEERNGLLRTLAAADRMARAAAAKAEDEDTTGTAMKPAGE